MRIFQFHLMLSLPSEFRSSLGIPSNLHYRDTALLGSFDLSVEGHYGSNTKAWISTSGLTRVLTERYVSRSRRKG